MDGRRKFRHSKGDDVESLFYVVLYAALRWLPHGMSADFGQMFYEFFDRFMMFGEYSIGGIVKLDYMRHCGRDFEREMGYFDNPRIHTCFKRGFGMLGTYYPARRDKGEQEWLTFDDLRNILKSVSSDALMRGGVDDERVEHDIEPYNEKYRRGIHESMDFTICRPAPTEREHGDTSHKNEKRKLDQVASEATNSRVEKSTAENGRGNKRRRVDDQLAGAQHSSKKCGARSRGESSGTRRSSRLINKVTRKGSDELDNGRKRKLGEMDSEATESRVKSSTSDNGRSSKRKRVDKHPVGALRSGGGNAGNSAAGSGATRKPRTRSRRINTG